MCACTCLYVCAFSMHGPQQAANTFTQTCMKNMAHAHESTRPEDKVMPRYILSIIAEKQVPLLRQADTLLSIFLVPRRWVHLQSMGHIV